MIDWVTAIFICDHDEDKLINGRVFSMNQNQEIEWHVDKSLSVVGSYESSIQIKSVGFNRIWVSGNPAKFLQGHNIFGTDDLTYLMGRFFDKLLKADLGLKPQDWQYDDMQQGNYELKRVDINHSWHLKSRNDVLTWIRAAGQSASLRHRGVGQFKGDTLYFGQNSRRWGVKCYSKGQEISARNHQLHKDLQIPELIDWAEKSLRIELVMRSMQLKDSCLNFGSNWNNLTAKKLLLDFVLSRLELSDSMPFSDDVLHSLPRNLQVVYKLWLSGEDLRGFYPKNTFYRHRRALLSYGMDISIIQNANKTNVVPLIRYLEAEPADIPAWAYEKGLVA